MPFIEEEKFSSMQQDFENAKLRKEEAEHELNEIKHELDEVEERHNNYKRKSKITSVILVILLGLTSGLAFYLYKNKSSNKVDIAKIRATENRRILDSIIDLELSKGDDEDTSETKSQESSSVEDEIANASKRYKNRKIYSVQIGAFARKKISLRSKNLMTGNISKNQYYKYSIGLFSNLNEARRFRRELVKIGFRDAFVASYINGKRQTIEKP